MRWLALLALLCAGPAEAKRRRWSAPGDMYLSAGGGVADFTSGSLRSASAVGAEWDARLTFGTRSWVAFETGYAGTYNQLAGSSAFLINHGFDGALRLNLLPFRVQPFLFGGVGYNHASVDGDGGAPRFRSSDNQLLIPSGAGVACYCIGRATLEARFTYRAILAGDLDREHARLDQWVATGRLGYTF